MNIHSWHDLVERYVEERHALGYSLTSEGRQLRSLADFLHQRVGAATLTVELALEWATQAPSGSSIAQTRRLMVVRGFARSIATEYPDTEIPPTRLLGRTHRRLPPSIFTEAEIRALRQAALDLPQRGGLRPLAMHTLLGLLAATGLRPGEAVRLRPDDVHLSDSESLIQVRAGKSAGARRVPLHRTTREALQLYADSRDKTAGETNHSAFFLRSQGKPMEIMHADYGFRCLYRRMGWVQRAQGHQWPRLYDLRHTFVCRRLLAWYKAGESVEAKIPYLANYLGHKKISSTYWYLSAIPELMDITAKRFEAFAITTGERS